MDRAYRLWMRRLARGLWTVSLSVGMGCAPQYYPREYPELPSLERRPSEIILASHMEPDPLPPPHPIQNGGTPQVLPAPMPGPAAQAMPVSKELPITLDTVLRLAEQANPRIGLAREQLNESQISAEASCKAWMPQVYAGTAYYRHEGGIQDFQGNLVHSSYGSLFPGMQICSELDLQKAAYERINGERQVWQQKAELSKVNNEILLEAATTYLDLLAARRGETLVIEMERYERDLLKWAEKTEKTDAGANVLVSSIKSSLVYRDQARSKLRQQGDAASVKLAYLLGLPPGSKLVPMEKLAGPIELMNVGPTVEELVNQALTTGPGVREMEGLLATIQSGLDRFDSKANYIPVMSLNLFEGAFGAGPGASLNWDNRLDLCLQFRWNLTELTQAERKKRLAQSKMHQAQLSYADLRGKLTAGVEEARSSVLFGREQMGLAQTQIKQASETYKLADKRLQAGVMSASGNDALQSIRVLEQAHASFLMAVTEHNKAQVRLLLLTGGNGKGANPGCAGGEVNR